MIALSYGIAYEVSSEKPESQIATSTPLPVGPVDPSPASTSSVTPTAKPTQIAPSSKQICGETILPLLVLPLILLVIKKPKR